LPPLPPAVLPAVPIAPAMLEPPLPALVLALPPLVAPAAPEFDSASELHAMVTAKQENRIGQAQRESGP